MYFIFFKWFLIVFCAFLVLMSCGWLYADIVLSNGTINDTWNYFIQNFTSVVLKLVAIAFPQAIILTLWEKKKKLIQK